MKKDGSGNKANGRRKEQKKIMKNTRMIME